MFIYQRVSDFIMQWKGLFFMCVFPLQTPRLTSSFWKSPDSKLDTAAMVQSCQSHTKHTQPNGWPEPQKNDEHDDEHDDEQLDISWYILGIFLVRNIKTKAGEKRRISVVSTESTESTDVNWPAASCQHLQYPLGKWWNNMGVSENVVYYPKNPMVLLIIIPIY